MQKKAKDKKAASKRVIGTPFKKGQSGNPRGLRPKVDKLILLNGNAMRIPEAIMQVYDILQRDSRRKYSLPGFSKDNPDAFYTKVLPKLIPQQIEHKDTTLEQVLADMDKAEQQVPPESQKEGEEHEGTEARQEED